MRRSLMAAGLAATLCVGLGATSGTGTTSVITSGFGFCDTHVCPLTPSFSSHITDNIIQLGVNYKIPWIESARRVFNRRGFSFLSQSAHSNNPCGLLTMEKGILDINDVVALLRVEILRAGGQCAFARKTGVDRTSLNKVLNGDRQPSPLMIETLGLQTAFVRKRDLD
jgi:hypothetical protein